MLKLVNKKYEKQNICTVAEYFPTRHLLITKRKRETLVEKPGRQVTKVIITRDIHTPSTMP